jgi:hypothetical protein
MCVYPDTDCIFTFSFIVVHYELLRTREGAFGLSIKYGKRGC